jgi:RNA polymerase sigma factor for flagellar operon FliA
MRDGMRSEKWTPGRAKQNGESRTIVSINDVRQRDQGQSVTPASCLACPAAGRRERLMLSRDVMRRLNVGMSRSERLILDLRYAEGMTMKEIGRVLGLAESQAAKKHRDLLDRLKEKLAEKPT